MRKLLRIVTIAVFFCVFNTFISWNECIFCKKRFVSENRSICMSYCIGAHRRNCIIASLLDFFDCLEKTDYRVNNVQIL